MKKFFLFLALLGSFHFMGASRAAAAAPCVDDGAGSVLIGLPALPSRGRYTVWSRVQVPDDEHTRYKLEINHDACFMVGGSSITPREWTWVSFQDGILTNYVQYDFTHVTDNIVRLIGADAGVRVDRLLLVKNDCVPEGLGSNCTTDVVPVAAMDTKGATEVPPPSPGKVSGVVVPSQTVTRKPGSVKRVVYYADGEPMPATPNFGLDTTLLTNGTHRVTMQITQSNGSVSNEITTLDVENPESAFSPLRRWVRLNTRAAVIISSVNGGALLLAALFFIVRHIRLQKRLLHFHGF